MYALDWLIFCNVDTILCGSMNPFKTSYPDTYKLLFSNRFMSHGDIVNIKLSVLIIFPQTELPLNLAVFNLLELAGGADIAEYECRRNTLGYPPNMRDNS